MEIKLLHGARDASDVSPRTKLNPTTSSALATTVWEVRSTELTVGKYYRASGSAYSRMCKAAEKGLHLDNLLKEIFPCTGKLAPGEETMTLQNQQVHKC